MIPRVVTALLSISLLLAALVTLSGCQVRVGEPPARQALGSPCVSAAECSSGARCTAGLCTWPAACTETVRWTSGGAEQTEVTTWRFGAHNRVAGFERTLANGSKLVHEDNWAFDGKAVLTKVVLDGVQQPMIRSDRDDIGRIQWEAPIFLADEASIARTDWKWDLASVRCQEPTEVRQTLAEKVVWRVAAECDDRGRAGKRSFYKGTDELLHEQTITYDAKGRLSEGATYDADGQLLTLQRKAFRDGALVDESVTLDYSCWVEEGGVIRPAAR